jgi:DNA-directed RNA polymerase subunit RPC12/RpoP
MKQCARCGRQLKGKAARLATEGQRLRQSEHGYKSALICLDCWNEQLQFNEETEKSLKERR